MQPHIGGPMYVLRVRIPFTLACTANLQDELAVLRHLQNLIVGDRPESGNPVGWAVVARNPHETFRVDVNAVFTLGPLVARGVAAPRFQKVACAIEDDDRRRRHLGVFGFDERSRSMQHPHVVLCVDREARRISQLPFGWHFRPCAIHLERRQAACGSRRLGGDGPVRKRARIDCGDDDSNRKGEEKMGACHGSLLVKDGR